MKTNGELEETMKVSPHIYELIKRLCQAIRERRLLYFYYESKRRKAWREIRPYMIIPNDKGNLELVGLPIEELNKEKKQAGHYLLDQLDMEQFQILDETFDNPGVPRRIVVITQKPVICRSIYADEDEKEVMKAWQKVQLIKHSQK